MSTRPVTLATPRPTTGRTVWSILGLGASVAAFLAVYTVAVLTPQGQWWDQRLWSAVTHRTPVSRWEALGALAQITPLRCVVALVAVALVAVAQGRVRQALVGIAAATGTFVSIELLKHTLVRPDHGIGDYAFNSLPSGHTGAVAALAVAALVALARVSRCVIGLGAAAATAVTGLAVVVAGWHRPSDAVASVVVAVGWTLAGMLVVQHVGARRGR